MGKGDKKSRRGKIILGTFGVRRRRNNVDKAAVKPKEVVTPPRPAKEKNEKPHAEVKEHKIQPARETKPKAEKPEKTLKQEKAEKSEKHEKASEKTVKETKAKKEKKV